MYSIDQGAQPMTGGVTQEGSAVKIAVPAIGGTYEGKLSGDGVLLNGTWTQGPSPLALNLTRATVDTAWTIPEPPIRLPPMAADANPSFEVATIKPSNPDTPGKLFRVMGRRFSTINTTMDDLITWAYGIHPKQITGAPSWFETEKFDLAAQPDAEGQPNTAQWKTMLQKLLADRFQVAFHHDKKELSVYAIVLGKAGSKLTKDEVSTSDIPRMLFTGPGVLNVGNATMADFAGLMQAVVLDRPVVDQTALPGRYAFTLKWTPDETQFGGGLFGKPPPPSTDSATAAPDLFTAMQEQFGLKLDSTKAPVDVFVIDRAEKPSAN
jgi:uncharacterized protein (TIGR03435 family)